jgi:hypothetical protein
MPKTKSRTNVKDLPKTAQELTPDQAKRVKGGLADNVSLAQQKVALGDGSVRVANIADGTSNTLLLPAIQKK